MNHASSLRPLAALALCAALLSSCAANVASSSSTQLTARGPQADPAVAPLAFLTGAWVLEQPGGALIEEAWGAPRGKAILGSFRRVLASGATPFHECTQIVAGNDGARLRQIHVHDNFDTDPRRAVPMVLRLEQQMESSVPFVPLEDRDASRAGSLERVSYSRNDANTLLLVVQPQRDKDGNKPAPPEFRMTRAG